MRIKIDDLEFGYSSTPVLQNVVLDLNGAQFISIIGPNGVGKSTLIHCMNKVLKPTRGTVMINDTDVSEMKLKDVAKIVGYVPYTSSDTFPLSVVDTVLMGRSPHTGWRPKEKDLEIVYNILKMLSIDHLADRAFNELSAGQHQKVMLARGLAQDPEILLLDEPTSNLDIRHQLEVTSILKELCEHRDMLIIMISHDINIASKFSDKIIMLKDGTIYAAGTPAEVITKENICEVYGVDSEIMDSCGRPHVVLNMPMGWDEQLKKLALNPKDTSESITDKQ
ncbi:MAG: ABC transporter ATP-binding protein [Candidatus Methanomethylophilaceae archaeon]|nr:ABC transporter ATP-binding protein [Candidatus Methanomethylophilaceae archaeon]